MSALMMETGSDTRDLKKLPAIQDAELVLCRHCSGTFEEHEARELDLNTTAFSCLRHEAQFRYVMCLAHADWGWDE